MGILFRGFLVAGLFSNLLACSQKATQTQAVPNPVLSPVTADPGHDPTQGQGSTPTPTPSLNAFGSALGKHSFGVVANRGEVWVAHQDGNRNSFAQLRVFEGLSSSGAYYGLGIGTSVFVGVGMDFDRSPVNQFQKIEFDAFESPENEDAQAHLSLNLIVDLNCDRLNPNYLLIQSHALKTSRAGVWEHLEVKTENSAFRAAHAFGPFRPLSQVIGNHPDACFFAGDIFDSALKRGQKMAPFQLVLGDFLFDDPSMVRVDSIGLTVSGQKTLEDFEE
jgi:hypothetical protein